MKKVKILDCTIRDGGYVNEWGFSEEFVRSLHRSLDQAGVDYMEAGWICPADKSKEKWCHLEKEVIEDCFPKNRKTKISAMINYGSVDIDDIPDSSEYPVDMIRVAMHKKDIVSGTEYAARLAEKGYETAVNYMAITHYTNEEILELVALINNFKNRINYFYVADSFGYLVPSRAREIFATLRFGTKAKLGFHPHNNTQLAFANTLEAIDAGVDIVDGSVLGMGRGAGNLLIESLLSYLEREGDDRYSVIPILTFADIFMSELRADNEWGYSLPQLLSGNLNCHPYYASNLLKYKNFSADEVYGMLKNLPLSSKANFKSEVLKNIVNDHIVSQYKGTSEYKQKLVAKVNSKSSIALVVCGGGTVKDELSNLSDVVSENNPFVVSVNRESGLLTSDCTFYANRRRFIKYLSEKNRNNCFILGPSILPGDLLEHLEDECSIYRINNAFLNSMDEIPANSGIEAAYCMAELGFGEIYIAGMDGYSDDGPLYYYDEKDCVALEEDRQEQNSLIEHELSGLSEYLKKQGIKFGIITSTVFKKHYVDLNMEGDK